MTYGDLVTQVLMLINSYSKKGATLDASKTADYKLKIPAAINEIQMDLATTNGKLAAELSITNATATYPTETAQALPANWLRMAKAMQFINTTYWQPFIDYRLSTANFYYNSRVKGQIVVSYWRKPTAIAVANTASPTVGELAQVIDVVPEAEHFVPVGVAGKILFADDNTNNSLLLNYYEARKAFIQPGIPNYGIERIANVY